jgi:hypothetical protein
MPEISVEELQELDCKQVKTTWNQIEPEMICKMQVMMKCIGNDFTF